MGEDKRKSAGEPPHIIIVGAGLAGLCAAHELENEGYNCTVLEASKRVGGRVCTRRFSQGVYGELGAMRIPEKHATVMDYVAKFGLKLRPFINSHPNGYFFIRGRKERRVRLDRIRELFALRPWEKDKSLVELWLQVVTPMIDRLTEAEKEDLRRSNAWKTMKLHDLDQLSLNDILANGGLSTEGIEFLTIAWGLGETLLASAATEHLREDLLEVWAHKFFEIEGGMELLPKAFERSLRHKPKMDCEVICLGQDIATDRVKALCKKGAQEECIEGDYLICTIPFSVLQRLDVVPPFSGGKQRAIRTIFYESATKVLVHAKRRFWETDDAILGGASYTDLLTGPTFYPCDNRLNADDAVSKGSGAFVACYNWGEAARRLGALPCSDRERLAIDLVNKFHPQLKEEPDMVLDIESRAWHTEKWSCGAFALYLPGQFARLHHDVVSPEGRIHFAGEHTSLSHSWMEGALESGRRAAREIVARAAQP